MLKARFIALLMVLSAGLVSPTKRLNAQGGLDALIDQPKASATLPAAPDRQPVPSAAAARESLAKIKEVFRDDYATATSPERRLRLASQLLTQSEKTAEVVDRYVLLTEAMRLASDGGDIDLSFDAIGKCADQFSVEAESLKLDAITKLAAKAAPAALDTLAQASLALATKAAGDGKPQIAQKSLSLAASLARKTKNRSLIAEINKIEQAARDEEKVSKELAAMEAKLAASPNDPDVCLSAGKHLCFKADDWQRGLPLLAKGSDTELSRLAIAETNAAKTAAAVVALADSWWAWAESEKGLQKTGGMQHAADLYELIIAQTEGLERARLEKRIKQAEGDQGIRGKRVALADLKEDAQSGVNIGLMKDGTYQGKPFTCLNQTWPKALTVMTGPTGASVSYSLPRTAKRLVGKAGVFSPHGVSGTASQPAEPQQFEILVDGRSVWRSPPLAKRDDVAEFDIDLYGARQIELRAVSKSAYSAWSAWLNPELVY
jgi:hypothetical protein